MGGQPYVFMDAINEKNGVAYVLAEHTYDYSKPGTYNVTLTVTDGGGLSTTKTTSVVVGRNND